MDQILNCEVSQQRKRLNSTSYSHVIDTYAWIEYFKASSQGAKARGYIEDEKPATPTIVVAEMSRKLRREVELGNETREDALKHLEFIRSRAQILELQFDHASNAGELDVEMKKKVKGWGIADSIILLHARMANVKVVTGDEHFRTLKEALFIK